MSTALEATAQEVLNSHVAAIPNREYVADSLASMRNKRNRVAVIRLAKKLGADMDVVRRFLVANVEVRACHRNNALSKGPHWILAHGDFRDGGVQRLRFRDMWGEPKRTWATGHPELVNQAINNG